MRTLVIATICCQLFLLSSVETTAQYCVASSSCGSSITNVSFATINNTTACTAGGYTNYSTLGTATINAGAPLQVSVSVTNNYNFYGRANVKCWIDFNRNNVFDAAEGFDMGNSLPGRTFTRVLYIPFTAMGGVTRMRVRLNGSSETNVDPCGYGSAGEIEDYQVNIIASATPAAHFTIHVKENATGLNNGTSWQNAFTTLSAALFAARAHDVIKVAKGTYKPSVTTDTAFVLKDSIDVFGGYPNTGNPVDADRNFSVNQTILSGNIGNTSIDDDNSPIIVQAIGLKQAVVDGFIVEAASGYNYTFTPDAPFTAAAFLWNANITIANCVFRNNNSITSSGSAMIKIKGASPLISNCYFVNNKNTGSGANAVLWLTNNAAPKMLNCVFADNHCNTIVYGNSSNPVLINNTYFRNQVEQYAGATMMLDNNSNFTVANSIFSGNFFKPTSWTSTMDSSDVWSTASSINISNSIMQNYTGGTSLLQKLNPKFVDTSSIAGADNLYFSNDDGLQLINPCSAGMNAGSNTAAANITTDILGRPRLIGNSVDMGAYEIQSLPQPFSHVVYVNKLATGNNSGTSWANAFTDLQTAAKFCSDTIKVAAGTFYPSSGNPAAFFAMENNRVVMGGYPTTGNPTDAQRNPALYPSVLKAILPNGQISQTLLSGSLVNNTCTWDGFNLTGAAAAAINLSRSASPVIRNISVDSSWIGISFVGSSNALLQKCTFSNTSSKTITCNNASPLIDSCSITSNAVLENVNGGNLLVTNSTIVSNVQQDVLLNTNSSPVFRGCIFTQGRILNNANSNPEFSRCEFRNMRPMINDLSSPVFMSSAFLNTKAVQNDFYGGIFYNKNYSNPKVINCVISGTATGNNFHGAFMYNVRSSPVVINTTVINSGVGPYAVVVNSDASVMTIKNCIFWNNNIVTNSNVYAQDIVSDAGSSVSVSNTLMEKPLQYAGNNNLSNTDPKLVDISNPAGADGKMFTADDGAALCSCSPLINKGDNSALTGYAVDILGQNRIAGAAADLGAYEFQSGTTTLRTFYVNASATGGNTGTDWANAYKDLQKAVTNSCADTIKVAAGNYKPALASKDSSFYLNRGVTMLGGYPATGSPNDDARNVNSYVSVMSGDLGMAGDTSDNSRHVVKVDCWDTTVVIDGFTITNGNASSSAVAAGVVGGGLYGYYPKKLLINNCIFSNNNASQLGGALYSGSPIKISNTKFIGNTAQSGAGYYSVAANDSISNCIFYNNRSSFTGGGLYVTQPISIKNSVFMNNTASTSGGGVYIENTRAVFTNCNIVGNICSWTYGFAGIAVYNPYGSSFNPSLVNCAFTNNTRSGQLSDLGWTSDGVTGAQIPYGSVYNAAYTFQTTYRDINNPTGTDGYWLTADDGLMPVQCSDLIDAGAYSTDTTAKDVLGNPRIKFYRTDIGAYEYQSNPDLVLSSAGDSLIANRTVLTPDTYTNFYDDCSMLFSVRQIYPNSSIGSITAPGFKASVKTSTAYNSGRATNLSNATYVSNGLSWYIMNRTWHIVPYTQLKDSALVKIPFTNADFNDLKGSSPSLQSARQMVFFMVDSPYTALAVNVPAANFHQYINAPTASTKTWKFTQVDTVLYAEFYAVNFGGGGAGIGTGANFGPLSNCDGSTKTFTSYRPATSYQWQVDTGAGFTDVSDNANYSGATSRSLTISGAPGLWYGYQYRCVLNATTYDAYNTLVFQTVWTGAISNAWENPGNWSCGVLPNSASDVIINTGNVVLNSNITVGSLSLAPGATFTVNTGYTVTVIR